MNEREAWLVAVGEWTKAYRYQLAERHDAIARRAEERLVWRDGHVVGRSRAESMRRWHEARARGHRERFARIRDCGQDAHRVVYCRGCGSAQEPRPIRCGQHRVCLTCRGERAARYQERIRVSREAVMRQRWPHGFRQVFLTLTYPHSGSVARDIRELYRAWPRFLRKLRRWLTSRHGLPRRYVRRLPFCRVVEVTASDGGHAHLHVWMLAPYVHHAVYRRLWGESLDDDARSRLPERSVDDVLTDTPERQRRHVVEASRIRARGRRYLDRLPWPVLDVRKVERGERAERELAKYLVKDWEAGELADPMTMADIFIALEGRRSIITSRYFWRDDARPCECCGARDHGVLVVHTRQAPPAGRDPPSA